MAVKTITVDVEAYELLARRKKPGMSFSQVIKVHLGPSKTARDLLEAARGLSIGPQTVDAIASVIRRRRSSPARAPKL